VTGLRYKVLRYWPIISFLLLVGVIVAAAIGAGAPDIFDP
jgi:hypothetical protein